MHVAVIREQLDPTWRTTDRNAGRPWRWLTREAIATSVHFAPFHRSGLEARQTGPSERRPGVDKEARRACRQTSWAGVGVAVGLPPAGLG